MFFGKLSASQPLLVLSLALALGCSESHHGRRHQEAPQGADAPGNHVPQGPQPLPAGGVAFPPPVAIPGPTISTGRPSEGSGGAAGLAEQGFRDSAGLSSSYKINFPQSASGSVVGLHLHLHGDGGGGYRDFPNKEFRNNLVGVVVKAPNSGQTWGRAEGNNHARYLNELIQNELVKKYNVDLNRIYFSGVSGGSYFLAGHFIPLHGSRYNSAAFLMCGGMPPQVAFAERDFLKVFRIHWEVTAGERSDITSSVRQSVNAYKTLADQLGIPANSIQSSNTEGPGGHCEFDGRNYTTGIQFMMDKKFSSVVK